MDGCEMSTAMMIKAAFLVQLLAHYCAFIISARNNFSIRTSSMSILREERKMHHLPESLWQQKVVVFVIVFDHQIIREDPSNGGLQLQQQHHSIAYKKGN